jgi:uncharacterized protein YjbJ (UPF0337 family)
MRQLPLFVASGSSSRGARPDRCRRRVKQAKGRIKEVAGKLLGNESLQAKDKAQKTLGKFRAMFGDVKQWVKHSMSLRNRGRPRASRVPAALVAGSGAPTSGVRVTRGSAIRHYLHCHLS